MQHTKTYSIVIKPVSFFRASEEIDLVRVHELMEQIVENSKWIAPIPVEIGNGIIMDGNHRLHAAILLGLKSLPCIPLLYSDPRVQVKDWNTDEPFKIEDIFHKVMNNKVFPYKTTRHAFNPTLPVIDVPLSLLK
jgi:hypothetical protein